MPALVLPLDFTPPSSDIFNLTLSKTIEGATPSYLPLNVQFAYDWDFDRNMGSATVVSISNNQTDKFMFTMGISGKLAFMAREQFNVTIESGEEIFAYRVLLNMDKETAQHKSAAMMIGQDGDIIVATENWGAAGL
ncbi:hypothetical protein ABW19_dt0208657 [Dactylella cylindrospora]|nr:hypothetical protein ABW19_dt0208657 [Dactylella cylindrospora]